uniref:RanBP-type and C3HC4-type zinc finger-containing protein 1 n=1 Tax=Trichogramma kaykai TaxID=54128 RepID=A0ABD2VWZ1_9HYME
MVNASTEPAAAAAPLQQSCAVEQPASSADNFVLRRDANNKANALGFSLFRWFKRHDAAAAAAAEHQRTRNRQHFFRRPKRRPSTSSIDTFYSTATVRSFAFHSGVHRDVGDGLLTLEHSSRAVGPFAPGAVKLAGEKLNTTSTCTLPTDFSHRQDIQTRYALHPVVISSFVSYDSIPVAKSASNPERFVKAHDEVRNVESVEDVAGALTPSTSATSTARKKVHVKGKRKAPDPPVTVSQPRVELDVAGAIVSDKPRRGSGVRRKRRPAPKPPGYGGRANDKDTLSSEASYNDMDSVLILQDFQTISNDTLVLRRGVLLSKKDLESNADTSKQESIPKVGIIMPRPWYKRNDGLRESSIKRGNGDVLRQLPSTTKLEPVKTTENAASASNSFNFENSLHKLGLLNRDNDKKTNKESKRVSILTNISELDREAAAIVREEQARHRASLILQAVKLNDEFKRRMEDNEDIVQEIVNASIDASPRRTTRALMPRFNGFGSITRSGMFKNHGSPKTKAKRFSQECSKKTKTDDRMKKEMDRYFPPARSSHWEDSAIFTEIVQPSKCHSRDEENRGNIINIPTIIDTRPIPAVADIRTIQTITDARPIPKVADVKPLPLVSEIDTPTDVKTEKSNIELIKSLAAELDDVAMGIARLRRELDDRPGMIEEAIADREKATTHRSQSPEYVKFDAKSEILAKTDSSVPSIPSISEQVAKVVEILTNANTSIGAVTKSDSPEGAKSLKKVSSAVQTSGKVRQVANEGPPLPPKGRTEGDRAVKLEKSPDNDFVNAMEKSLYANARPSSSSKEEETSRKKIDLRSAMDSGATGAAFPDSRQRHDEALDESEETNRRFMNTIAVNRSLRKLEAAIASGNHRQAAVLAKELAQLRIQCCVVRQISSQAKEKVNLNLYIEDKQAQQGPIPIQVIFSILFFFLSVFLSYFLDINMKMTFLIYQLAADMTVEQLKIKIHTEFEIPGNVQRWIIGRNLADNDKSTIEELQAVEGSSIFLYIVAPQGIIKLFFIRYTIAPGDSREKISFSEPRDEETKTKEKSPEKDEGVQIVEIIDENYDEQIFQATEKEDEETEAELETVPEPQTPQESEIILPEEKLKRYEELIHLENCGIITNKEPIECPVCFMICGPEEGVILRNCLHSFCRSCAASTVRYCEEAEVKCPYRDTDYTCDFVLQEREIKALVSAEVYQQHLAKSIAQAENNAGDAAFHCKTPDCPGWCIYDDNVNNFLCPVCRANNCLTCQAIHFGKNCRQYQQELKYANIGDHESRRTAAMLDEMVERGEALPCPTCAVVLMKKWGCDWLRCSMCKTEICWVTRGPRWGPRGKGDTSGGCRCGENGVKCHPRCNYCH